MQRLPIVLLSLLAGCSTAGTIRSATPTFTASPTPTALAASPRPEPLTSPRTATRRAVATNRPVIVRYQLVRHTADSATASFALTVVSTLADPRGWQRGDVRLVHDESAAYAVILAEPDEAQRLCLPYDVYRKYSCQNGPAVVLNAERWRHATPQWTGSLSAYRRMMINHEFGHLLGLHHPVGRSCPGRGQPAPVMSQQSTELNGCRSNPWPLAAEVARLARHDLPLAPPPP